MPGIGNYPFISGWAFKRCTRPGLALLRDETANPLFNSDVWQDWWFEEAAEETTALEDASLNLAAYYEAMTSLAMFLYAHDGVEFRDLAAWLQAREGWKRIDAAMWLSAIGLEVKDLGVWLHAARDAMYNLTAWLSATDPISLHDLAAWLSATDGTALTDLGLRLQAISAAPAFRAATAQRVSSIIHEVT